MNFRARRAGNRDSNHKEVQDELIKRGYSVCDTSACGWGFGDIVLGHEGLNFCFEIKPPGGKLNEKERLFHDSWQGQIDTIFSADDAERIIQEKIKQLHLFSC